MANSRPPSRVGARERQVCSLPCLEAAAGVATAAACRERGPRRAALHIFSRKARNHVFRCNLLIFKYWSLSHTVQSKEQADETP